MTITPELVVLAMALVLAIAGLFVKQPTNHAE
jgi:hypothetical protein